MGEGSETSAFAHVAAGAGAGLGRHRGGTRRAVWEKLATNAATARYEPHEGTICKISARSALFSGF